MGNSDAYSDVNAVRDATDLVQLIGEHVALRPRGREHVGLCPFHDDRTPSFTVVTHKGNAFYKCHACGAGGDAFDFVRNYHRLEFAEALRYLAERAGIILKRRKRSSDTSQGKSGSGEISASQLRQATALAAEFFHKVLTVSNAGRIGREMCTQRGITDETIARFQVGLALDEWDALLNVIRKRNLSQPIYVAAGLLRQRASGDGFYDAFRNRLIFPICNDVGQPIAFGARKINPDDEPKYLNSSENPIFQKSRTLYGLHLARRAIIEARQAIVTEGYTDVIACHQAGICNVVGTLGTALTQQHAKMLSRLCDSVVLLFDGDEAGQRAADRALEVFFAEPVDVKICILPDGADPDDLLKRDGGRDQLLARIANAEDALEFKVNRFRQQLSEATGISSRQKHFEQFMQDLANLGFGQMHGVRRSLVITQLADLLGISTRDIEQAISQTRPRAQAGQQSSMSPSTTSAAPAERDIFADGGPLVAPARRRAELDVLAIIVYEPQIAADAMAQIESEQFAHPLARYIAQDIADHVARNEQFNMQLLLARHSDQRIKNLLTSLYMDGQRICGDDRSAISARLVEAVGVLQEHIHREQYRESVTAFQRSKPEPDKALEAFQQLLEQRRKQPLIADAISQAARR